MKNFQQFSLVSCIPAPLTSFLTIVTTFSTSSSLKRSGISPEANKLLIRTRNLSSATWNVKLENAYFLTCVPLWIHCVQKLNKWRPLRKKQTQFNFQKHRCPEWYWYPCKLQQIWPWQNLIVFWKTNKGKKKFWKSTDVHGSYLLIWTGHTAHHGRMAGVG